MIEGRGWNSYNFETEMTNTLGEHLAWRLNSEVKHINKSFHETSVFLEFTRTVAAHILPESYSIYYYIRLLI